jgi:regulator of sigma E protease
LVALNGTPIRYVEDVYDPRWLTNGPPEMTLIREGAEVQLRMPQDFANKWLDQAKPLYLMPRVRFAVGEVVAGMPAEKAGLQAGDSIVAVNGLPVRFFDELQKALKTSAGQTCTLTLIRNTSTKASESPLLLAVTVSEQGTIGFVSAPETLPTESLRYTWAKALPAGYALGVKTIRDNIAGFGMIFRGEVPVEKSLGGPIAIAKKMYGGRWDWQRFWMTTALLSMILAFMNLLPIPALDGGHVVFLLVEMVTGKPLSERFLMAAQYAGMVLLILLMVFAFGNDLLQHVFR